MTAKRVAIIGSGFGGLAAACLLGRAGYEVMVLEKNAQLGGRLGTFSAKGFTFDTGPSWLLMPDVFTHFFALLGERLEDHLTLVRPAPYYRVYFKDTGQHLDITGGRAADQAAFDAIEPGAGANLQIYLDRAAQAYKVAMDYVLYKNYDHAGNFLAPELLRKAAKLSLHTTIERYTRSYFTDPKLRHILQYTTVFLGASPYRTPALYNLMSHVDMTLGVQYPLGGMYELARTLVALGKSYGVTQHTRTAVSRITTEGGRAIGVQVAGRDIPVDIVVSNADIHYTETQLLPPQLRDHSPQYWRSRTLAPSALLMYLGVGRTYPHLAHHNLVFSGHWRRAFADIFGSSHFPADPSFYVCAPSRTDPSVAPKGCENLFVLVPVSAGLGYTKPELAHFADSILTTIAKELHMPDLPKHIVYKKLFCVADFAQQFNSQNGTGLGLSHTLTQTAAFRPHNMSKKVRGLYYVGANVHPGIGLPTTLISAELLYKRLTGDRSSGPLTCL